MVAFFSEEASRDQYLEILRYLDSPLDNTKKFRKLSPVLENLLKNY